MQQRRRAPGGERERLAPAALLGDRLERVDDVVVALEAIALQGVWGETLTLASGTPTPLLRAARLTCDAVGSSVPIETPGGELPPGEGSSYPADGDLARLGLTVRPIEDAVTSYVEWLRRHPAAQGRS